MGGNYERAHNMDGLAQHQMSTAVRQVEGELGDGAKEKSGSVFTAANSRGIFGSGHYDLSNLQGRNFDESSNSDSLSHSSLTSQNTGYRGLAHSSGYNSGYTKSSRQSTGFASADYSADHSTDFTQSKIVDGAQQAFNQHSYGNQEALGSDYKYYSHGGNRAHNQMVGANLHSAYDSHGRRITDTPVRVIMRPGTIVTVPVSAQTYDASSSSLRGASYGQNSLNTEAEELSNSGSSVYVKPNTVYYTKPTHYESSYNYRKEWEKHNAHPEAYIPTENPFTKNSELYDDSLLLQNAKRQYNAIDSSSAHVGSDVLRSNIGHLKSVNAAQQSNSYNTKSSSGHQSQYNYETADNQNAAASAHSNSYTLGTQNTETAVDANDLVENIDSKPKSYHSSYAYHKSWERRGDPYVIKPIGGDNSAQISQKLVSASANQGMYSSHQYGSLHNQAHQSLMKSGVDCDENGHVRVARSSQDHPRQQDQQHEDLGQEIQKQWGGLEDMGQQTQNKWDNLQEQFSQQSQNLEDFGQQSQNLEDFGQQSQNLEDFGQQSQNLEDFGQQSQNLEDFGQQSQNLEDFGQQSQNLEDFGQQNLENFNQQHQNIEDLGQQNLDSFNQQHQNLEDLGQQNIENFNQQHQNLEDLGQHNLRDFGQQSNNLGQQLNNQWDKFDQFNEKSSSIVTEETPESFQEPKVNKESIGSLSDFNQHQESDKQKANTFWNQHQNFDAHDFSQNTDQIEGFTNEDFQIRDSQQLQNQLELQKKLIGTMYDILSKQKTSDDFQPSTSYSNPINYHHNINYNDGENQYTGFSHYSHEASNNGMSSSWQKQYNIQENNNNKPTAPLQNFWSKLDNLDTQGMINTNKDTKDDNLFTQMSDIDWSTSNWGQFHAHHDNHMFDSSFAHNDGKNTLTSQILKATTSVNSVLPTEIVATTSKPRHNPISNMPVSPIDIGRGDIGADETTEPKNENEYTNVYIPNSPHRHYKSTEEIESLSLTEENDNSAKASVNSQQATEDMWNQLFKHHNVIEHNIEDMSSTQTSTSTKPIKYKPTEKYSNTYTDKDAIPSIEKINKQKGMTSQEVEDTAHKVEPFSLHNEQKNSDQQDLLHSYNFEEQSQEPAKESETQQNVNEQFEDFGQQLQNTYDIGQSSQSVWEPTNSEHSEVQQLENFGSFENNDNQQFEPLERSNDKLQSQSLLNFEQHKSWEPVINQPNNQQQQPVSSTIKTFSQELTEKQGPPSHPKVIVPEETATEKAGFWKSFGSKFTGAKETVVSWFKHS
ncbi:unnamed protein product [Pieris brassicae]|uniref:Uncharacterized protein n=1 Tax=Pieris brassicae TaxID=7116 RepID=A0A9P0TKC7_PIEBR|nr:unnamed protein product [Pieris brassicae]